MMVFAPYQARLAAEDLAPWLFRITPVDVHRSAVDDGFEFEALRDGHRVNDAMAIADSGSGSNRLDQLTTLRGPISASRVN